MSVASLCKSHWAQLANQGQGLCCDMVSAMPKIRAADLLLMRRLELQAMLFCASLALPRVLQTQQCANSCRDPERLLLGCGTCTRNQQSPEWSDPSVFKISRAVRNVPPR